MSDFKVAADDFKNKIQDLDQVELVDIRAPEELNDGYIEGARNIDFYQSNFYEEMQKLDKEKPLALYCRSGRRSGIAAEKLAGLGFKTIYDLDGGILDWKKRDYEVKS